MSIVNGDWCRISGSGPSRLSFAQSTASSTRSSPSRQRPLELVERHERVLAGQRRVPGEVHVDVLAELAQRERRGEQRPERVAVRVLVRRDEEAVVRAQRLDDRVEVSLRGRRRL